MFSESYLFDTLYPFSIFSVPYIFSLSFGIPDEAILPLLFYLFALTITWLASFILLLFKKTFRVAMILLAIVTLSDAVSCISSCIVGDLVQQKVIGAIYNVIIVLSIIILQIYGYIKAKHMWNEIRNEDNLIHFMKEINYFHDSCIKEAYYLSGAYVDKDLSMFPVNNRRLLKIIIQRQSAHNSIIELEFQGLKHLKLSPTDEKFTCEILSSTMIIKDGYIYWCDCDNLQEAQSNEYTGTYVCASKLRWRRS